jgi:hypothetical protein
MAQACEQLTPQLLNERGLAEWNRCALLPPAERMAELVRLKIILQDLQAVGLIEAHYMRGLFGSLTVGRGKTLLSWLLPLMFPWVRRPLLILPGGLKKSAHSKELGKTEQEFEEIRKHWKTPEYPVKLIGYEWLSRKEQARFLCGCAACTRDPEHADSTKGYQPDLVIADESDMLKHTDVGKTRRVLRYVANHPHVVFVCMTGTMIDKSLRDFAHLLILALKQNAPIPLQWHVLDAWCQALDETPQDGMRRPPGALVKLSELLDVDGTETQEELADEAFRLRLRDTPGVIIDEAQSCDQPINIQILKPPDDPILEAAFHHFRKTETTPDGWDVAANFPKAAHGLELSNGFYNYINPRPPQPWIDARKAYYKLIKEVIDISQKHGVPMDTEAMARAKVRNHPVVLEWQRIEPTFVPKSVPTWISMSVLGYTAEVMRHSPPSLIWTQHIPVGETLEAMTGVSYYGAAGRNSNRQLIDNADPRQHAIVSIGANMRGRNLQAWNHGIVIAPSRIAKEWEQGILGRMHRRGQDKPVNLKVIVSSADALYSIEKACSRARYIFGKTKFAYKLLLANWDWSQMPLDVLISMKLDDPRRARWNREKMPEILAA